MQFSAPTDFQPAKWSKNDSPASPKPVLMCPNGVPHQSRSDALTVAVDFQSTVGGGKVGASRSDA